MGTEIKVPGPHQLGASMEMLTISWDPSGLPPGSGGESEEAYPEGSRTQVWITQWILFTQSFWTWCSEAFRSWGCQASSRAVAFRGNCFHPKPLITQQIKLKAQ